MGKIGIVTYHKAWNNGAFLQAFAMQEFFENHGFDVSIIDAHIEYKPFMSESSDANRWWRAYEEILKGSHKLLRESSDKEYDLVIYGSDEIWNLTGYGANPMFWGYRIKSHRKIAYAPCSGGHLGMYLIRHPFKTLMAAWALNCNFDAISVRDRATKELVNRLSLKNVTECLDPTFLIDFKPYTEENNRGDYVVVYSYGLQPETIRMIVDICNMHHYQIIYTGSYCDWADENPILTPFEWVNLMYHAKLVFTSTFHGAVFSIICGKEFYVVDTHSTKVLDLLYRLDLTERILCSSDKLPQVIDYHALNERINMLRNKSKEFLLKNIF